MVNTPAITDYIYCWCNKHVTLGTHLFTYFTVSENKIGEGKIFCRQHHLITVNIFFVCRNGPTCNSFLLSLKPFTHEHFS